MRSRHCWLWRALRRTKPSGLRLLCRAGWSAWPALSPLPHVLWPRSCPSNYRPPSDLRGPTRPRHPCQRDGTARQPSRRAQAREPARHQPLGSSDRRLKDLLRASSSPSSWWWFGCWLVGWLGWLVWLVGWLVGEGGLEPPRGCPHRNLNGAWPLPGRAGECRYIR